MQKILLFAILGLSLSSCSSDVSDISTSNSPNTPTDSGEETTGDSDLPGELHRLEDPVVVTGAQLSRLSDAKATDIVAFARREGGWSKRLVLQDLVENSVHTVEKYNRSLSGDFQNPGVGI